MPGGGASCAPPVQPAAVGLADGRGRLRLAEVALAAGQASLHDQATHHAGLDLLKVVRLRPDLGLQQADVRLIPGLLLQEKGGEQGMRVLHIMATKYINGLLNEALLALKLQLCCDGALMIDRFIFGPESGGIRH